MVSCDLLHDVCLFALSLHLFVARSFFQLLCVCLHVSLISWVLVCTSFFPLLKACLLPPLQVNGQVASSALRPTYAAPVAQQPLQPLQPQAPVATAAGVPASGYGGYAATGTAGLSREQAGLIQVKASRLSL